MKMLKVSENKEINPNAISGYEVIFPYGYFGPSKKVCDQVTMVVDGH